MLTKPPGYRRAALYAALLLLAGCGDVSINYDIQVTHAGNWQIIERSVPAACCGERIFLAEPIATKYLLEEERFSLIVEVPSPDLTGAHQLLIYGSGDRVPILLDVNWGGNCGGTRVPPYQTGRFESAAEKDYAPKKEFVWAPYLFCKNNSEREARTEVQHFPLKVSVADPQGQRIGNVAFGLEFVKNGYRWKVAYP